MKRMMTLLVIASMFPVQSCILENRTDCPTYLTLEFPSVPEEVGLIHLVLEHEDGTVYHDTVYREDYASGCELPVRKGRLSIAAFGNPSGMFYDRGYTVPEGSQADSMYTCFLTAEYRSDLSRDTVTMLRNYIGLHIRVLGDAVEEDSIHICVESASVGYNLHGDIITGRFRHTPAPVHIPDDGALYYEFLSRITRQDGYGLYLSVLASRDSSDRLLVRTGLSSHLRQAGIGMEDAEMEDLYVTVDFSEASIKVSPVDWNYYEHVEIEI